MISGTMACGTWMGSLWFERISESRRPRFEPDIDNVPHEFFLWHARRGGCHFGSNVSAKAASAIHPCEALFCNNFLNLIIQDIYSFF